MSERPLLYPLMMPAPLGLVRGEISEWFLSDALQGDTPMFEPNPSGVFPLSPDLPGYAAFRESLARTNFDATYPEGGEDPDGWENVRIVIEAPSGMFENSKPLAEMLVSRAYRQADAVIAMLRGGK